MRLGRNIDLRQSLFDEAAALFEMAMNGMSSNSFQRHNAIVMLLKSRRKCVDAQELNWRYRHRSPRSPYARQTDTR
jgi:hypothetical protein